METSFTAFDTLGLQGEFRVGEKPTATAKTTAAVSVKRWLRMEGRERVFASLLFPSVLANLTPNQ